MNYKASLFDTVVVRVPGLMLFLPEGDLGEAFEAADKVREAVEKKLRLPTAVQGRIVFVPMSVAEALTPALEAAEKALLRLGLPALVIGLYGDLSTWDVRWANYDAEAEQVLAAVAEEITAFRSVTRTS